MDKIYRPVYNGLMRQRPLHDERVRTILGWRWDYIAPCHGEPVSHNAKVALAEHLAYEGPY